MIQRAEKTWLMWFTVLVLVITSLPYLIAYAHQGTDWVFTGFVFGVEDGNSYIAKMLSGSSGAWLFKTPYTAYPQKGVVAFLPYLLLGKLTAAPTLHDQLVALFHLFRLGGGILYIIAAYRFLAYFIQRIQYRRFGVVIVTFGGGLGWILPFIGQNNWLGSLPLELISPESFGFLSVYGLPHLAVARAMLAWGIITYLRPVTESKSITLPDYNGLKLGVLWVIMGFMQPLSVVVSWTITGTHLLITGCWLIMRRKRNLAVDWSLWKGFLRRFIWALVLSSPLVIYTFIAFSTDPFLKYWTLQNRIFSPHPLHYLIAYGLIGLYSVFGLKRLISSDPWKGLFFGGWLLLLPVLAYLPYNLQRRLPEGIWLAWVLLAMVAIEATRGTKTERLKWVLTLSYPTAIILILGGGLAAYHKADPIYLPVDEVEAFQFLAENVPPGSVILTAFESGNALPAWAPVKVVLGHGPESVGLSGLQEKTREITQASTTPARRLEIIQDVRADYLLWGPHERELGGWNPAESPFLTSVFKNDSYEVYKYNSEK